MSRKRDLAKTRADKQSAAPGRNRSKTQVGSTPAAAARPNYTRWIALSIPAVAVAVAVAVSASGTSSNDPVPVRDSQVVADGEVLFVENCAVCHGVDLQGTETGPPFMDPIYAPNHHADEAFQRAVAVGVQPHHWNFGSMPPIETLTRSDVEVIVQYVRSEQEAAGVLRDSTHP